MSEIRLNPITREWVIIAKEKGKKPEDFIIVKENRKPPEFLKTCPFCPGNETVTPKENSRFVMKRDGRYASCRINLQCYQTKAKGQGHIPGYIKMLTE